MTCASCVHRIESNMITRPGVLEASVALATSKGRFVYDSEKTGVRDIIAALKVSLLPRYHLVSVFYSVKWW